MRIARHFTAVLADPLSPAHGCTVYDLFKWDRRTSKITDVDGSVVFQAHGVEVPAGWGQIAVDILASKYLRKAGVPLRNEDRDYLDASKLQGVVDGHDGYLRNPDGTIVLGSERSMKQVAHRLALCWTRHGAEHGYFSEDDASVFYDEIVYMLLAQMAAPNSPQWFNAGLFEAYGITGPSQGHYVADPVTGATSVAKSAYANPQIHACFIQRVDDTLLNPGGIFDYIQREARLFKYGSGSGANVSSLRASNEPLSSGGRSSGLMSWLRIADASAGAIKSGGTTRRAAKMVVLNADHPNILDFIRLKAREEIKVAAMVAGQNHLSAEDRAYATKTGLNMTFAFDGEAYQTVTGQNANNSVRVTDEFMHKVTGVCGDVSWNLTRRTDGAVVSTMSASALMDEIAEAAWRCADPGMQFDTTYNDWHTCPNSGRINGTNPCCFVGSTLVDTAEGRISFDDLMVMQENGEPLPMTWAFSRKQQMPVLRQIRRVWKAGDARQLVEVVTDKGIRLRCTPEHRFLLRDGRYVKACDLRAGDRLRKIGRWVNSERSDRRYINHRTTDSAKNGTTAQAVLMWESVNGPVPVGYEVHHVNGDATDDRLSNLVLRERTLHRKDHSGGLANPRAIDVTTETLVEVWEAIESSERVTHKDGDPVTVHRWNKYIRKNGLQGQVPLGRGDGRIRGMEWRDFAAWIESQRSTVNDKVYCVKQIELDTPIAVYDMEVAGTHNFAVTDDSDTGRHTIVVHNSEYAFLDNTACNLASLNVVKFYDDNTHDFDIKGFMQAIGLWTMVLDISVLMASYPSEEIAALSWKFRTLGLGYANMGALLMRMGIAYESEAGAAVCAAITSILTGHAYTVSASLAEKHGPFAGYADNANAMLGVICNHADAAGVVLSAAPAHKRTISIPVLSIRHDVLLHISARSLRNARYLSEYSREVWHKAYQLGVQFGFRNAQVTVIAPTGTIGLLMECDTTGIEPDFSLVKFKKLSGGGMMRIVNASVRSALVVLGMTEDQITDILRYIDGSGSLDVDVDGSTLESRLRNHGLSADRLNEIKKSLEGAYHVKHAIPELESMGLSTEEIDRIDAIICGYKTIEGCPHLPQKHYAVFDCASPGGTFGRRFISWRGHLRMMAAAQAFISGSISKTINMPSNATVSDVRNAYIEGWRFGIKAIALYRDGSKRSQPLKSSLSDTVTDAAITSLRTQLDSIHKAILGREGTDDAQRAALSDESVAFVRDTLAKAGRRRRILADDAPAIRHKFIIGSTKGYLTVTLYDDGTPGEIFIQCSKAGSTLAGFMDSWAIAVSNMLQYGVPVEVIVRKFAFVSFAPHGLTQNAAIPFAKSLVDYVARWLGTQFVAGYSQREKAPEAAPVPPERPAASPPRLNPVAVAAALQPSKPSRVGVPTSHNIVAAGMAAIAGDDAPPCDVCGALMHNAGGCWKCESCGNGGSCG